ncbi:MAG: hypothetical protein HQ596_03155 [Candidatus Saganbacteria bacterium]|nr:hypothetical protein [Candidatus Saganbacteria bacterium]
MEYKIPQLILLDKDPTFGGCYSGNGASSNGCAAGPDASDGDWCAIGTSPGASCGDGGTTTNCYVGNTPSVETGTRCNTGSGPG